MTVPAVNLYGFANDLTIVVTSEDLEGWDSETQKPDPYTRYETTITGATNSIQGNGTAADALKNAVTMFSWYTGLSENHPTFEDNSKWAAGDRLTERPW